MTWIGFVWFTKEQLGRCAQGNRVHSESVFELRGVQRSTAVVLESFRNVETTKTATQCHIREYRNPQPHHCGCLKPCEQPLFMQLTPTGFSLDRESWRTLVNAVMDIRVT
jgi:hypothetical protein